MPYKKLRDTVIKEIIRRLKDGQRLSEIASCIQRDRKTVRRYISEIKMECKDLEVVTDEQINRILCRFERKSQKQDIYSSYLEEIRGLLSNPKQPLKVKSVYEVLQKKYELPESSLSSFKRYLSSQGIKRQQKVTCRIERAPGAEIQVDYAKAGKFFDTAAGKNRTLYIFIGTLPYSRHKYAEFVFSQDQKSFVESHVKMFRYFQGVTTVTLDNLKAGIIKPDLYDPVINKSYYEMAEHYNCFINPCRVAKPKDKPTVERDVQTIREEFKKMMVIEPSITLQELNYKIKQWLINDYGQRKHGTTNLPPYEVFKETEQPLLNPLPADDFEISQWKEAKVHPDSFIQVNKKFFSVPYEFIGKTLSVQIKSKVIYIFCNNELIKTHLINKDQTRHTDYNDFPENIQHTLLNTYAGHLIKQSEQISGKNLKELTARILVPHTFINVRNVQAILAAVPKYPRDITEQAAGIALEMKHCHSKDYKRILISLSNKKISDEEIKVSEHTKSFLHPIDYFIKQPTENTTEYA